MTRKVTKKELVSDIIELLKKLGLEDKYDAVYLHKVPNISWVSYRRVLKRTKIASCVYQNSQPNLYSKEVSVENLLAIRSELDGMLNKELAS